MMRIPMYVAVSILAMAGVTVSFDTAADMQRAEGPRRHIETEVISPGEVLRVRAGGDFQAALERASPGDTIELETGAVYQGPFILPYKPASTEFDFKWITIRSSDSRSTLPPAGTRVTPEDVTAMARLVTASGAIITTAPGAHHYRFIGIEFKPTEYNARSPNGNFLNALIDLSVDEASGDPIAHHLIIERCYLHGDPQIGTRRGIIMNSGATAVVDSYLADFKMIGHDSQAIIGWQGPGPYLIRNNYLEAAGENLMFGGADPTIRGRVPSDILIRGNHFSKPISWKSGSPGYTGTTWSIKNLLELKNARRVLIDGNLLEYNWEESQNGFAILFTVRNQEGSAPWSVVEDVVFSNNVLQHVANGINILGHDNNHPSQQTRRILIRNNLFTDVGGDMGPGHLIQILDSTQDVFIVRNTANHSGNILRADGRPHRGFVFRANIVRHNKNGIVGTNSAPGNATLESYFGSPVVNGNIIVGGSTDSYPTGNIYPAWIDTDVFTEVYGNDNRPVLTKLHTFDSQTTGVDFGELCSALSATERQRWCTDTL